MKVSDGNGTKLWATLGLREWIKFLVGMAAVVSACWAGLRYFEANPEAMRLREARTVRIEKSLEEQARLNEHTARLLKEHLEQTTKGYERLSAVEEHSRSVDRELDRIQDRLRRDP